MSKTTKENGPENQRVQSQHGDQRKDGIDELGRCRERPSAAESEVETLKAQSRDIAKPEAETNDRAKALATWERELRQLEGDLEKRTRIQLQ